MKISIIIPSRERAFYLEHSLATVTAIDDPDLEIVVSDNASVDNTRAVVETCGDPRVCYFNTGARLSMRQNFEFSLRASTGEYVIMFGDDDGMIPKQFPYLREILHREQPDALSWDSLIFGWPMEGAVGTTGSLRMRREKCFGKPFQIDAAARLKSLERGHLDMSDPLPVLYHGCMSRAYLEELKGPEGDYFKSMSPDLYISFRAVQHGGNFLHINHPFSIAGFSPASTGGSMASLGGKDEKKPDLRFLTEIKTDPMQDVIPVTKSMALAFLGTVQTVQDRHPEDTVSPDFFSWYQLALKDQKTKDASTAAEIAASLDAHAEQFGSRDALDKARNARRASIITRARKTLKRTLQKVHSFRVSGEMDGRNTIKTAADISDALLRDELAATLSGTRTHSEAWTNVRRRGSTIKNISEGK